MDDIYLVQSWSFKKNNTHNDDVDIMGIFRNIENAKTFLNERFMFFMTDRHRDLCEIIFPKIKKREEIFKIIRREFDDLVTGKIVGYIFYDYKPMIMVGDKIPNKAYNNQIIKMKLSINKIFNQLMELQKWISNHTPEAYFNEYCEIPIIINDEITGIIKRMSSETCRLILNDNMGIQIYNSFYLGHNMIDVEDCEHRERHFCTSYRICNKTFRD